MTIDYSHGWRRRDNLSWSGIRLHVPEKTPRRRVTTVVIHQWGAEAGLSEAALHRIARGYTTEAQEWQARMGRTPYHFGAHVLSDGSPLSAKAWPGEVYTNHCTDSQLKARHLLTQRQGSGNPDAIRAGLLTPISQGGAGCSYASVEYRRPPGLRTE